METENKITTLCATAPRKMKSLGRNPTKHVQNAENYQMLLKEIKEDLKGWRDVCLVKDPGTRTKRQGTERGRGGIFAIHIAKKDPYLEFMRNSQKKKNN